MKLRKSKRVAMLILLTFLFTSLFSFNPMGGPQVAEAMIGDDCGSVASNVTEQSLINPTWYDKLCIDHIDISYGIY